MKKLENHSISTVNLILIDWITFTSKIWSVDQIKSSLGLFDQSWDLAEYGRYGYKRKEVFNGVSILYDGRLNADGEDDMGICVECSGQGCRSLESFGHIEWLPFLAFLMAEDNEFKITRLDIAYDDHTGILDKLRLKLDTDDGNYRSKFRKWEIRYGNCGFSIYHGSKQSQVMIRIYDKAAERGLLNGTHWIRVEMQLRDENATGAIKAYLEHQILGKVFSGILVTYLVYCEESNDSNKSRWPVADYWEDLIQGADRIRIAAAPGVEYNIFHMEAFLRDTAGGALDTWIKIFGLDSLPELLKKRKSKLNPKHKRLLDLYQQHKRDLPDLSGDQ